MSRCAVRVRRTSRRRERRSGTILPGREFGGSLFSKLIDEVADLLVKPRGHIVAAVDGIKAFLGGAQPFQLGFVFLLALLREPEAFAHHLTSVAEATGCDAGLDEAVKVFRQVYVAGRHDEGPPPSTLV